MDEPEIEMSVIPSPGRRGMAVVVLAGLGLVLLWLGWSAAAAPLWGAVLAVFGIGALWSARRLWDATGVGIELTAQGLRDGSGRQIARWEEIAAVQRGPFAMKPSNGFGLTLTTPGPRIWEPGLWWRSGRRVGIGGVLPGHAARAMAERIATVIAARDDGAA